MKDIETVPGVTAGVFSTCPWRVFDHRLVFISVGEMPAPHIKCGLSMIVIFPAVRWGAH